ncbi:uncharacterized protein LACBIDRAFT_315847 [Laccaria bicolor S238N-H82]|uniref:Predicted protein n=1 Tax=Laccaria bicolor (strain S238N-H82 / ATCC MYA-4686) TaxID=486041 RepID=B0D3C0_LACBS|nr:uncharacterized protein LACBIDRAFT_315847 [Laccaria bicolor S238N-H82]EDR10888.1 predicted protein [Laccaria bicolor S238N-H82]|eukprot:XP_001878189.1 predicted protein [Laccaria bicolor S238N-H82]
MSAVATSTFLNSVKAFYPTRKGVGTVVNPWYIVAAVAFSASNKPEGVSEVFRYVLQELPLASQLADRRMIAGKLREAIFKSGLISGYPKAINSLKALHEATPEELRETKIQRDTGLSLTEYEKRGDVFWRSVYGDTADNIQVMLNSIYPDMGWFSKTIGYGITYSNFEILSPLETSYALVASLIAGDTPQQIAWHLDGARRGGATLEEAQAVRKIAMEVASHAGVRWQEGVPEIVS